MALTRISTDGIKDGTITGADLATNVDLVDNKKIRFGTGNDLAISHDGTNSIIDNTTGELQVTTDGIMRFNATEYKFNNAANNEIVARFEQDGACELYHNHSKKLETTASGVDVTGNCTITGNFRGNDGVKLNLGNGDDLQIYHDGTDDRIMSGSTNSTIFASKYLRLMNQAANETMAKFFENGAVELYHNNVKKLETVSDGVKITAAEGGEAILSIHADEADDNADQYRIRVPNNDGFRIEAGSSHETALKLDVNAGVELYYDNSKKFETKSDGVQITDANPLLHIQGTGNSGDAALFLDADDNHWLIRADNSGSQNTFSIKSGTPASSTHRLLIDSSGNVGINDTSPTAELSVAATAPHIDIGPAGSTRMKIGYEGNNCFFGATASTGMFIFKQNVDLEGHPQASGTERMRIDSSGHFLFNCTSLPSSSVAGMAFEKNGSSAVLFHSYGSSTGSINVAEFINGNGTVGRINTNGSTTTYHTSSDYRLKENQIAISDGITRLKSLKPYRFNFKADSTKIVDGFFAHEVSPVVPEAIWGEKDAVKEDGSINPQGIDQSKLVPLLVAAVQEAISKIEVLETEVAALKAS